MPRCFSADIDVAEVQCGNAAGRSTGRETEGRGDPNRKHMQEEENEDD